MEITVDTSAILAVCLNEPARDRLVRVTARAALLCPPSVHWEIGNALSAMLKRNRISIEEAKACVSEYQKIPIKTIDADLIQSIIYCRKFGMYAYDSYILVCALQSGTPLLSLDSGLNKIAEQLGIQTFGEND